ncbi:GAP family protein [Actinomadura formosensis]|uniref:GAP family protein n=1 Tax=Actinomadura formosensis TaxID=60706 RepID=UPI000834B359|nr:GAP family protein [Actinomadura formosensis]
MNIDVLPLAITMLVGPQIISALVLVTSERAVLVSLAFLGGVLTATTAGLVMTRAVAALIGAATTPGGPDTGSTATKVIEAVLVALLIVLAVKNYLGRDTAEPPRWLSGLMQATARHAFTTGFLVILLMPSDLVVLLTVGMNLERSGAGLVAAIPFIAATLFIAALPLLAFLVFHRRAVDAMPRLRDWMTMNSWLVNIVACLFFVVLILT